MYYVQYKLNYLDPSLKNHVSYSIDIYLPQGMVIASYLCKKVSSKHCSVMELLPDFAKPMAKSLLGLSHCFMLLACRFIPENSPISCPSIRAGLINNA